MVKMGNAINEEDFEMPLLPGPNGWSLELEPIAIIGVGCRFPGGASNPQKLWSALATGSSAWSKGTNGRFNMETFHDPSGSHPATVSQTSRHLVKTQLYPDMVVTNLQTNTMGGHFLTEDIAAFDASFFGINAVEARVSMAYLEKVRYTVAHYTVLGNGSATAHLARGCL